MSAVVRVRGLLKQADRRAAQSTKDVVAKTGRGDRILAAAVAGLDSANKEEVTIKGTGRAIEKVLDLAAWFGERELEEGVKVRLSTGSIWAVDDIVQDMDATTPGDNQGDGADTAGEIPESRMRRVSVLEAKITLR
jgi:ribonuclease P/MRP protein subunit POP7